MRSIKREAWAVYLSILLLSVGCGETSLEDSEQNKSPLAVNSFGGGLDLCAGKCGGSACCGSTCYAPASYDCVDGMRGLICPKGYRGCGRKCYEPGTYVCIDSLNDIICPKGTAVCSRNCYDPSVSRCADAHTGKVCPLTCSGC